MHLKIVDLSLSKHEKHGTFMVSRFRSGFLCDPIKLWGILGETEKYSRSGRYGEKHRNVSEIGRLHGSRRFMH